MKAEYELSAVKIAYPEYFTMDDYRTDLDIEAAAEDDEDWVGEDEARLEGIPDYLWSDAPIYQSALECLAKWIDDRRSSGDQETMCDGSFGSQGRISR